MNLSRIISLSILPIFLFSCSSRMPATVSKVASPLGLYKSNTNQKYWLAIMQNNKYLLCSTVDCFNGKYERVPANYGVILIDFYKSQIGLDIEKLSHGLNNTESFYVAMKKLRMNSNRANDLAFNIGDCYNVPCVGIGHTREGVKFYRIEDFDQFWPNNNQDELND